MIQNVGQEGEEEACRFLIKNMYTVVDRNFRARFGELDIIAIDRDGVLVFVEVKTLSRRGEFMPEDQMSPSKLNKLKKMCIFYSNNHPDLVTEKGWRLDLLALTKIEKDYEIKHYENIV